MFNKLREKAANISARVTAKAIKHAPELLFIGGTVAFVATVVMAVKAAPKITEIIEEHNAAKDILDNEREHDPEYTTYTTDVVKLYRDTTVKVVRTAGPVVAVGAIAVGCYGGAHYVVCKRLTALSAEYMILDETFKQYRSNVVAAEGIDKDDEYYYSMTKKKEEVETLSEDGTVEKKEVETTYANVKDGSSIVISKETVKTGWFTGIDKYDSAYIESCLIGLENEYVKKRVLTRADILRKFGLNDILKETVDTAWMFGKIYDGNVNDLGFKIYIMELPDYEKEYGNRVTYHLTWNEENLYNVL